MKINMITCGSGWILQKIAERIKTNNENKDIIIDINLLTNGRLSNPNFKNESYDINFFIDFENCYHPSLSSKCDVCFFTHAYNNSKETTLSMFKQRNAFSMKGIVSMNERYTKMLREFGFKDSQLITLVPGQTYDMFPLKKITLGIFSRGDNAWYNKPFVKELFMKYDLSNFKIKIVGKYWDDLIPIAKMKNIDLELYSNEEYDKYVSLHHSIDYLLIQCAWTAGPMCMQEALSCGTPIISADVGFTNYEFKADYVYSPGNLIELSNILDEIQKPRLNRRKQVQDMSWKKYTKNLIDFLCSLNKKET